MEPVPFKEINTTLGQPAEAENVHVTKAFVDPVTNMCITKWQGTWRERWRFLRTGIIWLSIRGAGMPPTHMSTEVPFEQVPDMPSHRDRPER